VLRGALKSQGLHDAETPPPCTQLVVKVTLSEKHHSAAADSHSTLTDGLASRACCVSMPFRGIIVLWSYKQSLSSRATLIQPPSIFTVQGHIRSMRLTRGLGYEWGRRSGGTS
jgi:hypothetical protein